MKNSDYKHSIQLASGQVFQITPEHLDSILRPYIKPDSVKVIKVDQEPLVGDTQFNAVLLRLYLTYDQAPTSAPRSLIAKLPTAKTENLYFERIEP